MLQNSTSTKKILITGASSQIMHQLIQKIQHHFPNYQIIGITRSIDKQSSKQSIQWLKGDITNRLFLEKAVQNIDIIIHAAAITHSFDPEKYELINLKSTKNLVAIACQKGVQQFAFISSRAATMDSGAYGISKLLAEQYLMHHFNNWLIFRPSEIYGSKQNEGIDKLVHDVLTKAIIPYPQNVPSKLYPTSLADTTHIIFQEMFVKKKQQQCIIINGPEGFSYKSLIQRIAHLTNKRVLLIPVPKMLMFFLKKCLELFQLKNSGIVPDQVPRLYSQKPIQQLPYKMAKIDQHIQQLLNQKK